MMIKKLRTAAFIAASSTLLMHSAYAASSTKDLELSNDYPPELQAILNLKQPTRDSVKEKLKTVVRDVRLKAVRNQALILGSQSGLFWRGNQLKVQSERMSRELDMIWDFQSLMIYNNRVIPPVITDIRGSQEIRHDQRVTIGRDLLMVKPARFVQAPPTWRDYLLAFEFIKPDIASQDYFFFPTENEVEVWQRSVKIGWEKGVRQGELIMSDNVHRLSRDFNGMIQYHVLLDMHMISHPFVSEKRISVEKSDGQMSIDKRIQTITVKPMFNKHSERWIAVPAIPNAFERSVH